MKHNISLYGIVIIYAVMFSACSDDLKNELGFGHEIAFEIEPSSTVTTRSATEDEEIEPQRCITETADTFYLHTYVTNINDSLLQPKATTRGAQKDVSNLQSDGFKVSAYNTSDGTTKGSAYFEFLTATYAASKFTPQSAGNKKYWPAGKLMFYAYYPAATVSNGITQGSDATLTYSVPSTPANHPDLMTAKLDNQQYSSGDGTSSLTFNHALCAIKFQTGTDIAGGTINSITFSNIKTSGTYNLDTNTWTDTSAGNVSCTGLDVATTEGTANTAIISGDNTLMMIPQSFDNNNQKITLDFTDENGNHKIDYILNGHEAWTRGQCITYRITTEDLALYSYTLEVNGGGTEYSGGNVTCGITSYRTDKATNDKEIVGWSVVGYSTDGGSTWSNDTPSWLSLATTSGSGSTTEANITASLSASSVVTTEQALSTAIPRGSTTDYFDLSKHNVRGDTTLQNTANCYVVNAPGYYKFPVVFGNAIKNGVVNTSAYHTDNTGELLTDFLDHNNSAITTPYINIQDAPYDAVLIWQDVQDLIQYQTEGELTYDNTTGYVKFHIAPSKIAQGNAVIAVRNSSGTIIWSWHIWVTPTDIMKTIPVTEYNGSVHNMMSINLGWCGTTNTSSYAARCAMVKVRQSKSGRIKIIRINQYSDAGLSTTGNCPYYQWGRKDPMCPGGDANNVNKTYWGTGKFTIMGGQYTTIPNSIQAPFTLWSVSDSNWQNTLYLNLWDTNCQTATVNCNTVTKTVYDPCPPGFKIPPSGAYTGFTKTGGTTNVANSNVSGAFNVGFWFYTNSEKTNTIFFPAKGYRDAYSGRGYGYTYRVQTDGDYLTASTANRSSCYCFYFLSASTIYPTYVLGFSYGCNIRPIEE